MCGEPLFSLHEPEALADLRSKESASASGSGQSGLVSTGIAGAKSTGPLLARPAGADAFPLANVFPINASPVGLSNRKGSFTPGFYAGMSSEYDVRALRGRD